MLNTAHATVWWVHRTSAKAGATVSHPAPFYRDTLLQHQMLIFIAKSLSVAACVVGSPGCPLLPLSLGSLRAVPLVLVIAAVPRQTLYGNRRPLGLLGREGGGRLHKGAGEEAAAAPASGARGTGPGGAAAQAAARPPVSAAAC